jgi:ribonuclease HI
MHKHLITYTDGGSRGNPGPSALGVVIKTPAGETLAAYGEYLGVQTNNYAEYMAILSALRKAKELGAETVEMRMDSELAVRQLTGEYKVKNQGLAAIYLRVHNEVIGFRKVSFHHVRRELNTEADAEVNKSLDRHLGK